VEVYFDWLILAAFESVLKELKEWSVFLGALGYSFIEQQSNFLTFCH